MPEKKRQHYLPQFYLRFFSTDEEKKLVSLYNHRSQRFISSVPIKRQGYKDYLYGEGEMEYAMGLIELAGSKVLARMISDNSHPKYKSSDHHAILVFIMMLYARTPSAGEEINGMIDRQFKVIFSDDPRFKDELKNLRIGYENPVLAALSHVALLEPLMYDLGFKLLVNRTTTPFITSDHPVVLYNQFFEARSLLRGGNTGLGSVGLQMFLPISPNHLIMFYDKTIYKIGGIKHKPVLIRDSRDVDYLNGLQFLNSRTNLFFNQDISKDYIDVLLSRFSSFRREGKSYVNKFKPGAGRNQGTIVLSSKRDIECELSLTFVRLSKKAKNFKFDNRLVYSRNELLSRLLQVFRSSVLKGEYKPSDFDKFLRDFKDKVMEELPP